MKSKKKSVGAVLLTLVLTFLIAGSGTVFGSAVGPKSSKNLHPARKVTQSVKKSAPTKASPKIGKYDLVKETYSKNKITIRYPQISNMSDKAKQKKLNAILKKDALKLLNNYKEWASVIEKPYEEVINASIDYQVKWKGANLLSVAYSGYSTLNDERSERNYHTINLDLNTGKQLMLKDLVNIDKNFMNKFITKKFKSNNSLFPKNNKAISDEVYQSLDFLYHINSKPNYKELQQYFEGTDSISSDSIDTSCDFSYVTDHSLGIAVMVSHAAGNYAEFEIGLDQIKDNIKTKNEAWKDFPKLIKTPK